jgi:NAD(P)-dependent dehydrogenase (short-subunit alcohol dehydrogenase family)
VIFDDLDFRFRDYDPWAAYGQSKTANVLFAVGASARWADEGILANALMPGGIATNLQRHLEPGYMQRARASANLRIKTVEQGAATSVLVATAPELEGIGGRYFEDCHEAPTVAERGGIGAAGVAPYALDPDNADRLWEVSSRLVNA